jgi:amino acid transporter
MTSIPARATGAPQDSNFTRNATGLVREVSMWDALIMNTLGMNVAVGSVLLLQQAPAIFPGGNMVLAVVIGTVIMAFTLLWVYSEFAAAMPRSGGDYVFVSRALHPFLGWVQKWLFGLAGLAGLAMVVLLIARGTSLAASWDSFAAKNGTLLFIVDKSISSEFAVTAHLSVEFMLGVIASGVLWYIGAVLYNKRRGVNLNLTYKEIPPE